MKKKVLYDSVLNIIAVMIPIFVLQIIILPLVAKTLGESQYGSAITIISFSTLFSLPLGNVLNNLRLLFNDQYTEEKIEGDFNLILFCSILINSLIMIVGSIYFKESTASTLLTVVFSMTNILKEYLIVSFRIRLNYRQIVLNNIYLASGYIFGLLMFMITDYWQMVYLFGNSFSLVYILKHSDLLKENLKKTKLFKDTFYNYIVLFASVFLKNFMTYGDKIFLHPLIGPEAVAIYYSATLISKVISMFISPITSVLLSHLTKINELTTKSFIKIIFIILPMGSIGYFIILIISNPLLKILYPQWITESLRLIPITGATAIIALCTSILHPFILRFKSINWQILINFITVFSYIIFSYLLYLEFGLIGFCIGVLISNAIRLLLMISIFMFSQTTEVTTEINDSVLEE